MTARRIVARPGSQKPRRRQRPGRLDPLNGSVTRADIERIFGEYRRGVEDPQVDEFLRYLLGAIQDPSPGPRTRAKQRAAALAREAQRRRERRARSGVAQVPVRAAAAA